MEANTQRRAAGLKDKIPDIQKTLETVRFLKTRKVFIHLDIGEAGTVLNMGIGRLRSHRDNV
jgi:hypothetical protein